MALQWMFLLLLTLLLVAQNRVRPNSNNLGEQQEKGKQCSLLCSQEKVLLCSFCRAAVQLYGMQDTAAVSERSDIHTGAQVHQLGCG